MTRNHRLSSQYGFLHESLFDVVSLIEGNFFNLFVLLSVFAKFGMG